MTDNCHLKVIARSGGNHTSDGANDTIYRAMESDGRRYGGIDVTKYRSEEVHKETASLMNFQFRLSICLRLYQPTVRLVHHLDELTDDLSITFFKIHSC